MRPGRGRRAGRGGERHASDDRVGVTVVERAAGGVRQGRVGGAVDLALVVGRDSQGRLGDGENAVDVGDRIIGGRAAGGRNGVSPGRGGRARRGGERHASDDRVGVTIVERAARGIRQGRVGGAVDLALVVGGDSQRRLGDTERAVDVGYGVVGRGAAAGRDGVRPGGGRRARRG